MRLGYVAEVRRVFESLIHNHKRAVWFGKSGDKAPRGHSVEGVFGRDPCAFCVGDLPRETPGLFPSHTVSPSQKDIALFVGDGDGVLSVGGFAGRRKWIGDFRRTFFDEPAVHLVFGFPCGEDTVGGLGQGLAAHCTGSDVPGRCERAFEVAALVFGVQEPDVTMDDVLGGSKHGVQSSLGVGPRFHSAAATSSNGMIKSDTFGFERGTVVG